MAVKYLQIPSNIEDPSIRRFIEELLKKIGELEERVINLEKS